MATPGGFNLPPPPELQNFFEYHKGIFQQLDAIEKQLLELSSVKENFMFQDKRKQIDDIILQSRKLLDEYNTSYKIVETPVSKFEEQAAYLNKLRADFLKRKQTFLDTVRKIELDKSAILENEIFTLRREMQTEKANVQMLKAEVAEVIKFLRRPTKAPKTVLSQISPVILSQAPRSKNRVLSQTRTNRNIRKLLSPRSNKKSTTKNLRLRIPPRPKSA